MGNLIVIGATVSGSAFFLLLVCVVATCALFMWRRNRSELGVCMPLREVQSLEQLRASFLTNLPTSHFSKFTGGWLVLPEHTAAHGKLLELLRQRSIVLDSAQPWVAATGLARVLLAEADDILPVLLGESDTLDLLLEDAYLVVRFSVLPRGRITTRARLLGPRAVAVANPPPSPRIVYVEQIKATNLKRTQNRSYTGSLGKVRRGWLGMSRHAPRVASLLDRAPLDQEAREAAEAARDARAAVAAEAMVRSRARGVLPLVGSAAPRRRLPRIQRPWRRRVQPSESPQQILPAGPEEEAWELRAWRARSSPTRPPPAPPPLPGE